MKILLIIISTITLLFTSCDKNEMGVGGTTGGGMSNSFVSSNIPILRSLDRNIDFGIVNVRVTHINGEVVFNESLNSSSETSASINTSEFPSGIYYINISGLDGETIQQDSFVIE